MKKSLLLLSTCAWSVLSAANFEGQKDNTTTTDASCNETSTLVQKAGDGGKCYDENTHLLNIGLGLGGGAYVDYYSGPGITSGRTPIFVLSYEQPIRKKVGPGYIGLGPYFSFQNAHEHDNVNYSTGEYRNNYNWNYFVFALKGAYHWDVLNAPNAELYAGTIIGAQIRSYNYSTTVPDPNYRDPHTHSEGSAYPALSLYAGARWYFVPQVALYGEAGVGTGVSFLTGGFSFKF